jgi:hypothetical protein
MVERSEVLTIRSFIQMILSEHEEIKMAMRLFVKDEHIFRGLEIDETSRFLNWREEHRQRGTSTIVEKTRRDCRNVGLEMKLRSEEMMLKNEVSEYMIRTAASIGHFLTQTIVRPRWQNNLIANQVPVATFVTLNDNADSNRILRDIYTTRSSALFRFIIADKPDNLPTLANIQRWFNTE